MAGLKHPIRKLNRDAYKLADIQIEIKALRIQHRLVAALLDDLAVVATITWSASRMVLRRWAITKLVRPPSSATEIFISPWILCLWG
jgi:hypothetical protein